MKLYINLWDFPLTLKKAIKYTTYNGTKLKPGECPQESSGFVRNGIIISYEDQQLVIRTTTVYDGRHVKHCSCHLNYDGTLQVGYVNCFSLGKLPMDQDYLNELLEELSDTFLNKSTNHVWDELYTE